MDVPEDVVADLVGEDDFDLVGGELVQQRIAQEDAAGAAQSGQHGVGLHGLVAEGHAVDALDRQAGARGQPADPRGQFGVVEPLDLVEQRQDQHRQERPKRTLTTKKAAVAASHHQPCVVQTSQNSPSTSAAPSAAARRFRFA